MQMWCSLRKLHSASVFSSQFKGTLNIGGIVFRGACLVLSLFLLGCAAAPPPSSFATLVLTGSVNPKNTFARNLFQPLEWVQSALFGVDSFASSGAGSPTSVLARFYRLYVSAYDDCSSPVVASDYGVLGVQKDLTFDPVLFAGSPAASNYQCVAVEMDDTVSFRPDNTAIGNWPGVCTDTTMQYPSDQYRSDDVLNWRDIKGNSIAPRGTQLVPVTDRIFLFASTSPVRVSNGPAKAQASQIMLMRKTLEAPTSFVLYADFAGQVSGSGSVCHLNNPTYGVR